MRTVSSLSLFLVLCAVFPVEAQVKFDVGQYEEMMRHPGQIQDIVFSPDSKAVASVCAAGEIHLYNTETKRSRVLRVGNRNFQIAPKLDYTSDGKWLIYGNQRCVQVIDPKTGETHAHFGASQVHLHYQSKLTALVSPDGKYLMTLEPTLGEVRPATKTRPAQETTGGTNAQLWDIQTKKLLQSSLLDGVSGFQDLALYAPDGRSIAVPLGEHLCLLDGKTGKLMAMHKNLVKNPNGGRIVMQYLPDGQTLYVTGGREIQPISMRNLEAPRLLAPFKSPGQFWNQSCFSADGTRWYIVPEVGGGWKMLDRMTLKPLAQFPTASAFRLSADGKTAVYASQASRQIISIDPETGRERGFITFPDNIQIGTTQNPWALSPNGERVAFRLNSEIIEIRSLKTNAGGVSDTTAQVVKLPAPLDKQFAVRSAAFSQDERILVLIGNVKVPTVVLDGKTFQQKAMLRDPLRPQDMLRVHAGAISADGSTGVFIADVWGPRAPGEKNRLVSADLKTGKTRLLDGRNTYHFLAPSSDGRHLVAILQEPGAEFAKLVFQTDGGKLVILLDKTRLDFFTPVLGVSNDGKWVCAMVKDSNKICTQIWDTATGEAGGVAGNPSPLAIYLPSDNKSVVAIAGGDMVSYNAATGQESGRLKEITKNAGSAAGLDLAPSGQLFAQYTANAELFLKSAVTGDTVARFSGHTDSIYLARFSPSGKKLISFSFDGTMRVWEVPSKR
jgi:WD40 repeat protein